MRHSLINKILDLLNYENSNNRSIYFTIISIIAFLVGRSFGFSATIIILFCLTSMMVFATIIQILRKDRIARNIVIYLLITLLLIFLTVIVWMMQYYSEIGNDTMFFKIIMIFLSVIAIIADALCIIGLFQKNNSKSKKISLIVVATYMTLMAIFSIIFLPLVK